jgi:hypothetical protein
MRSGFLVGKSHLIMDRDPLFTREMRGLLRSAGVEPVRLPAQSPNLNAFAERFVLSIKSECLGKRSNAANVSVDSFGVIDGRPHDHDDRDSGHHGVGQTADHESGDTGELAGTGHCALSTF